VRRTKAVERIERWFKGSTCHDGRRKVWREPGSGLERCLALACETNGEIRQLASILTSLFPERICCPAHMPTEQLIHFNNHPDTTRDEIDKIMHTYHLEYGED
jgi:hypothetical protein